ncbi:MAG: family 20 glycosylhydrolase [Chitinophagaceae bacterium]|nr:family 20 glycosylhydrolase [Chitinophagaceae bacterium]
MKKPFLSFVFFLATIAISARAQQKISIIPEPVSVKSGSGKFVINNNTAVYVISGGDSIIKIAKDFSEKFYQSSGIKLAVKNANVQPGVKNLIQFQKSNNKTIGREGYELSVSASSAIIKYNNAAGAFYAIQTLYQLLPNEVVSKVAVKNIQWTIPSVNIIDYPGFRWRGLMLDVARNFFTKAEVKQFIDEMIPYKYNILHLHLTDDEGWRIEIKSLPNLTKIGAYRGKRLGKWANTTVANPDEPKEYGGYYTHEDVQEIVQYAAERFVDVMPEIDVPGHSRAAVASYPELTCSSNKMTVYDGVKYVNWPVAVKETMLCPGKEITYSFIDKVVTEVAQLFPFEYIHMGGDECAKNFWEASDSVQQLIKREGLKGISEVQSYFSKRVEKIVESHGKKFMGWNEIIDGGLPPSAAVMAYRDESWGVEATMQKHDVVMTPLQYTYLDYFQSDSLVDPPVYDKLRLNQTYKFNPVPSGADAAFIMGGQGNLWTEQVPNMRTAQFMLWPRSLAIAESVWSPNDKKNWLHFTEKVEYAFARFDIAKVKYSRGMFDAIITAKKDASGKLMPVIETELPDIDVYYSLNESNPDEYYPKYTAPFSLPDDVATIKVVTYRKGKQVGKQINVPVEELGKRVVE